MAEKQAVTPAETKRRASSVFALDPFMSLRGEVDSLFDEFSRGFGSGRFPFLRGADDRLVPSVDISETEKEVQVKADLPGMDEKDIEVSLSDGRLTIKGERKSEQEEKDDKDKSYHRIERSYGLYQRTVSLPCEVDEGKTKASFAKGVLTVTLPKTEKAKSKVRRIAVKGS